MPARPRRLAVASLAALFLLLAVGSAAPAVAKKSDEKPGKVKGVVLSSAKEPAASTEVRLAAVEGDFRWSGRTDAEGRFEVELPPGDYAITLPDAVSGTYESKITVAAKEELNLEIVLRDKAMAQRNEAIQAYNAGTAAYQAGDEAKALGLFRRVIELDPSVFQAYVGIADLELRAGNAAAAAEAIDRYRAVQPEEPNGRRLALEAYVAAGRDADAATLAPTLAADPESKGVAVRIFNLGVEALHAGEADRALARFELATTLDPRMAPALSALATVHYNAERYDAARAALERLFAADAQSVAGRRLAYLVADAEGDAGAARTALEAYQGVDPAGAADLLVQRAALDFEAGDPAAAQAAVDQALAIQPDHPRAHYQSGLLAASRGDSAQARRLLERFLVLAPNDPEAGAAREMLKQM